jgi:(p)ppGpp synthase/HD superfamily hydrolase
MKDRIFERALKFVQKMHKGQFRAGKVPVWQHLLRVSETLAHVLSHTKEGTPAQRQIISIAALGHDLLEDTQATKAQIKNIFGERGFSLIEGMTNVHGDSNHAPYIRAMKGASEEVRLIKLADLYDNVSSVAHTLPLLGKKWTTSFFLPIVVPMFAAVKRTKFRKYRKTVALLIALVDVSFRQLEKELEN